MRIIETGNYDDTLDLVVDNMFNHGRRKSWPEDQVIKLVAKNGVTIFKRKSLKPKIDWEIYQPTEDDIAANDWIVQNFNK